MEPFVQVLGRTLSERLKTRVTNNWDWRRFGPEPDPEDAAFRERDARDRGWFMGHFFHAVAEFRWLYESVEDEESRRLLIDLIAYRMLGPAHVKLPLNSE